MVSFFGLKFGADKRKKRAESPPQLPQHWNQAEEAYIGRRESHLTLKGAGINRPRTSQGTHGPRGLYPGDPSASTTSLHRSDADFRGIRAVLLGTTAAVPAGTGPVLSPTLKTFSSDSNLRASLETRNLSSTSLNTMQPRRPALEARSELGPRPGTAHSMRGSGGDRKPLSPLQPLTLNPVNMASTSALGGAPPKSPLAYDESSSLSSPGQRDSKSSLGTMRDSGDHQRPSLHIDLPNVSTTTFGGTSARSPLGQYELTSPLKSDTDSLLGDDPGKVADEIAARITREEKQAKSPVFDDKGWLEAELEEQRRKLSEAKKNLETARLRMAYPSPPASIESEQDVVSVRGRTPSLGLQGGASAAAPPPQERRLAGMMGRDTTSTPSPSSPRPGISDWPPSTTSTDVLRSSSRGSSIRQGSVPTIEAPLRTASPASEQSNTDDQISADSQMLRPHHSRGATLQGANAPRSPLFQQINPFDIHSDEEEEDQEEEEDGQKVDHRAANAPYGLPSPPLSHRQRPSKEDEEEGRPVLRTVQAKRDTTLVGGPGRTSLGLQIEEFAKSLQQAQAMSALENGPPDVDVDAAILASTTTTTTTTAAAALSLPTDVPRSRASSNASSAYSDLSDSESPVVIEPPLVSPKPFPLSPRPMGPRSTTPSDRMPSTGRPTLEVRAASPFGEDFFSSFAQQTLADSLPSKESSEVEEEQKEASPATPAERLRPRPRLGAVKPARPNLGEYGPVKVNTVAALAGRRVRRPSPDEYGLSLPRTASPAAAATARYADSAFSMDSPILKDAARHGAVGSPGPEDMTDGLSSTDTSRTTSPIAAVASYSVFSPPPPVKRPPPPRSAKPEWFGPAPTAPPTSPLPIPEKSAARRMIPAPLTTPQPALPQPQQQQQQTALRTSPSIVPDMHSNPNWPLPGPSLTSPPEGGFAARRSLQRERRAPPAPINIMATRYADEVGGVGGPWTPDAAAVAAPVTQQTTAGEGFGGEQFEIRSDFSGWKEEPAPYQHEGALSASDDKSGAIGVARGPSIKYDKIRERERRARAHDRKKRMAIVTVDEEDVVVTPGPVSPATTKMTTGEPLDRLRRPNHGLKSPMGFADEQGIRFI